MAGAHKRLQRRVLTLVGSRLGLAVVVLGMLCLAHTVLRVWSLGSCAGLGAPFGVASLRSDCPGQQQPSAALQSSGPGAFRDNIGAKDFGTRLAYGPMDVVYTWVNGSDPWFLRQK